MESLLRSGGTARWFYFLGEPLFTALFFCLLTDKKTIIDGDVIGGSGELIFNAEWIFPIYRAAGLKGVLFFDAGHAFDTADGFLLNGIRTGAGFGIRWQSPIGPIRLELGFNLSPKKGEKASVFEFTMGRAF